MWLIIIVCGLVYVIVKRMGMHKGIYDTFRVPSYTEILRRSAVETMAKEEGIEGLTYDEYMKRRWMRQLEIIKEVTDKKNRYGKEQSSQTK